MNGIEVCQWLHSTDVKHHPQVLLLAKRSSKKLLSDAYRVGADDLLTTPFQLEELRTRVSAIAQRATRTRLYHPQPGQIDLLESYRMDLAYISKLPSHV
jgi:DNA-binding response OmpR family regulator